MKDMCLDVCTNIYEQNRNTQLKQWVRLQARICQDQNRALADVWVVTIMRVRDTELR